MSQITEVKYYVDIEAYESTTEHGGRGSFIFKKTFDTRVQALQFINDMKDEAKFAEFSKEHGGHCERVLPGLYRETSTIVKLMLS